MKGCPSLEGPESLGNPSAHAGPGMVPLDPITAIRQTPLPSTAPSSAQAAPNLSKVLGTGLYTSDISLLAHLDAEQVKPATEERVNRVITLAPVSALCHQDRIPHPAQEIDDAKADPPLLDTPPKNESRRARLKSPSARRNEPPTSEQYVPLETSSDGEHGTKLAARQPDVNNNRKRGTESTEQTRPSRKRQKHEGRSRSRRGNDDEERVADEQQDTDRRTRELSTVSLKASLEYNIHVLNMAAVRPDQQCGSLKGGQRLELILAS